MGDGPEPEPMPEHVPSSIAALTPAPRAGRDEPSVVVQQRAILQSFDEEVEDEEEEEQPQAAAAEETAVEAPKAEVVVLPKRVPVAPGRKAAFTLRLDPERHLRLRLACAVTGRSAQQIVTGALDEALAAIPEIEALASRVPVAGAKRS
jgi:predicted HicB family RNase H-like nuclease